MKDGIIPGGTPPGTEVKHEAPGNSNAADPGMDIAKAELALTAARAAHMQASFIEGLEIDLQIRKDRQPVVKTPISSRLQAATSESNRALHQRTAASNLLAELKQKVREADQALEKAKGSRGPGGGSGGFLCLAATERRAPVPLLRTPPDPR